MTKLDYIYIGLTVASAIASAGMVVLFAYCLGGIAVALLVSIALIFLWLLIASLCKAASDADFHLGI